MTMTPKQIETRKRLRDDFTFYCKNCVKIRTKDGTIAPLILNRVQTRFVERITDQLLDTGKVRFVVVKARQQGLSTVISAWQYWWLASAKAQKGLVMAHVAESTSTLFDMYHRIHSNVPKIVQPTTKYSSRRSWCSRSWTARSALLRQAVAALLAAKCSTWCICPKWPSGRTTFAQNNFNGLIQAVPDNPGTAAFLESTANGMTGVFYEQYKAAKSGQRLRAVLQRVGARATSTVTKPCPQTSCGPRTKRQS
jgi:hypothetical protein